MASLKKAKTRRSGQRSQSRHNVERPSRSPRPLEVPSRPNLPIQSESQKIGTLAARAFQRDLSDDWIDSGSDQNDFGWDYWISIRNSSTRNVGPDFFVQLKGTGCPGWVSDTAFLSQELSVSAVNYLLQRSCPVLLAVCDVEDPTRPIYWAWLEDALEASADDWHNQKSVTLRIPKENRFVPSRSRIEAEALSWHADQKIRRALAEAAAIAVPHATDGDECEVAAPYRAKQRALVAFAKADLIDVGPDGTDPTPVSAEERDIRTKLREAKTLIDSCSHKAAAAKLAEIEADLIAATVSAHTRALFLNRKGVLHLRELQYASALDLFKEAVALAPDIARYQLNLITADTLVTDDTPIRHRTWLRRVDRILKGDPTSEQAIHVKARVLATRDIDIAETFLRSSPLWRDKRADAQLLLAELLAGTNPVRALEALDGIDGLAARTHHALSLRGYLQFKVAMGSPDESAIVHGFGPGTLDLEIIRDAAASYENACNDLARLGYPRFGEDVFRNAAQVLVVAGRPRTAIDLCNGFLRVHPDSLVVLEGISVALNVVGEHDAAAEYLTRCVVAQPTHETAFRNLLMALFAADRFHELHERAHARLSALASPAEEKVCREFLALASAQLGNHADASHHLRILEGMDDPAGAAVAAALDSLVGRPQQEIRDRLRDKSEQYPTNAVLAGHLVAALLPITPHTAPEVVALLRERIAPVRQLSPREAQWLGRAEAEMGRLEAAEGTFRRALVRFPGNPRLAFDLAVTLSELGRVDEAYDVMCETARSEAPTAAIQQNLALLAASTGRLDRSIELFEQALHRTRKPKVRRALAGQLFELRKRRGDGPKELLRIAMQFGRRADGSQLAADIEARFLMMCLLSCPAPMPAADHEVQAWTTEVQTRLTAFCDQHPKHRALRRFKIPEGVGGESLLSYVMTDLLAEAYPALLRSQQLEISARSVPYPLAFRARMLSAPGNTTVSYWEYCITSADRAHAIHCVLHPERLAEEAAVVPLGGRAVIDVTALLTLNELGLLDEALGCFETWIIAPETRRLLEAEALGLPAVNARAKALSSWLVARRSKVTVRHVGRSKRGSEELYEMDSRGLFLRAEPAYSEFLLDGIGASMELANQLKVPLFTDEAVVRDWVIQKYAAKTFGTVAFLAALRERGNLAVDDEAGMVARLLNWNYRSIPVGVNHLHAAVRANVHTYGSLESSMNDDPRLGPLLRHLGDYEVDADSLVRVSAAFLAACIIDPDIPPESTDALAFSVFFKNQQRAFHDGGIVKGPPRSSDEDVIAMLGTRLLVFLIQSGDSRLARGWILVRYTVGKLYRGNVASSARIAQAIASMTVGGIIGAGSVGMDVRNGLMLRIANAIPDDDRELWFKAIQGAG
jgi:tetratricopeptide (TPR) repeat protein